MGLEAVEERVTELAVGLRTRLQEVRGVRVHDLGQRRCGIVSFGVDGVPATDVQRRLSEHAINTSTSRVEYAQLDLPRRGLPDLVRASVHYYNDDEELDRLAEALAAITR